MFCFFTAQLSSAPPEKLRLGGRLLARQLDGTRRDVDPRHASPYSCQIEGTATRTTTIFENIQPTAIAQNSLAIEALATTRDSIEPARLGARLVDKNLVMKLGLAGKSRRAISRGLKRLCWRLPCRFVLTSSYSQINASIRLFSCLFSGVSLGTRG